MEIDIIVWIGEWRCKWIEIKKVTDLDHLEYNQNSSYKTKLELRANKFQEITSHLIPSSY
jgi:hypothetical protein